MFKNGMRPVHPGEVLREEFQNEMGFSAAALARALGVSTPTVNNILLERGGVSADMALRLAVCLDTTPEFWLNLQTSYELRKAEQEHGAKIAEAVQRLLVA
ncbi:HigA family addiction module antitoxin [Pseudomonas protegens]|uniref:HigA family addiction module antitoxin n=1 Tax=Pseudomonas protegens TaxID=380021 RepID=UPI00382AAF83